MPKQMKAAATAAVTVLAASGAFAQETNEPIGLEEIVVTAQKVEQDLQKVPISITAVSDDALRDRGISEAADLEGLFPGVRFQPIGVLFANIRGVGTFNLQPGVDSAVQYALDGNYIALAAANPALLFDMERVEVLRGPQGTLFGRNSNAGAVNLVTAKPTDRFEAMAQVTGGNYGLFASEAMLNVPLGDSWSLRGSFGTNSHDPYLDDGHNDADTRAGRLRLLGTPTDKLTVLATVDYSTQESNNNGASPCPPGAIGLCAGERWEPFLGNPALTPTADFSKTDNFGAYAELTYSLDFADLTWIPTYRKVHYDSLATPSYPSFGIDAHDKLHTQELRLASKPDSRISWQAGLYYSDERLTELEYFVFPPVFGIPGVDGVANFFLLDPYDSTSKAIFGQATFPLTDRLRATAGLRYTDEKKESRGTANAYGGTPADPELISAPTSALQEHSGVTWKAGLEMDLSDTSLGYLSVSTGFKSGGINQVTPGIGLPTTYEPEEITAYQLGTKNRFLDDRLQLNAEVFFYEYEGFQTLGASFQPSGLLFFLTQNSEEAEFKGGEVEATFLATEKDRLSLAVSLLDARYTKFVVGGIDRSGIRANIAPRYAVNAGYEHIFTMPNSSQLRAGINSNFVGKHWVNTNQAPGTEQGSYSNTSVNLTYEFANSGWSVSAWGRNLEDEGVVFNVNDQPEPAMGFVLAPRTYGISVLLKTQ
jgi:iron complex outermembrane receptor protein